MQKISRRVGLHISKLESKGFKVDAVDDFSSIKKRVGSTGRLHQTPMMDVDRLDFTQRNAFWLFLTKDGEDVAAAGAKFVDIGDEGIEAYLRRTSQAQYGFPDDPILEIASPLKATLGRKLVYIGELEFARSARGGAEVLEAFIGVLKGLCALQWGQFDWMYAFIPEEHLKLERFYHFSLKIPRAITWKQPPPPGRSNSHYVIAEDRSSYRHAITSWEAAQQIRD